MGVGGAGGVGWLRQEVRRAEADGAVRLGRGWWGCDELLEEQIARVVDVAPVLAVQGDGNVLGRLLSVMMRMASATAISQGWRRREAGRVTRNPGALRVGALSGAARLFDELLTKEAESDSTGCRSVAAVGRVIEQMEALFLDAGCGLGGQYMVMHADLDRKSVV